MDDSNEFTVESSDRNAIERCLSSALTRRQLIIGGAAAAVGLSSLGSLIAACGSSGGTSAQSSTAAKSGITVGSYGNAVTLDPMTSLDGQSPLLWRASYEKLLGYKGNTTEYVPELAESFEVSKNSSEYVFHLRPNITFSDGEPWNAEAAKVSVQRQIDLKQGVSYALGTVKSLEATDDLTFVVRTDSYTDGFVSAFGSSCGVFMISPKAIKDHKGSDLAQSWLRNNMVGTGPYVLDEYTPGEVAKFSKNPKYWRGWAGNHASQFNVQYVHSASTAQLQLQQGALDAAVLLPDNVQAALRSQPGLTILEQPSLNIQYLALNCSKGPTKDKRVRQAIAYGFNYDAYVKQINSSYKGAKQPRGPIPSTMTEYVPDLPQYTYDPARAKELLKEAGYPSGGFTLTCIAQAAYPWTGQATQLFKSNMGDLGITVEPQSLAAAAYEGATSNRQTAPGSVPIVWWALMNTPYDYLGSCFNSGSQGTNGYNKAYYSNPEVDRLMAKANSTVDANERLNLFGQCERLIVDDSPYLFLMEQPYQEPQSVNLRGFVFNGMYIYTYNIYDMYMV